MDNGLLNFIHGNQERYLRELAQYLSIPSVSAIPEHAADIRRCAEWTAEMMAAVGLQNVRLIETAGNPIVYGDWLAARDAPTVLCYGHYDVQPADPLELWESPPFQPAIRDGKIYARGATDDKGQLFAHIKAIEAHLRVRERLPVNLKVIVEGEEEIGGTHLDTFVRGHQQFLAADVVVISDGAMFAAGVPSICRGLRGLAYFQVNVRSTSTDLHSGSFGGAVANSAMVLAQILARMKDDTGRITIPGFYDDVRPLSTAERLELAELPFDADHYRAGLGAPLLFGEPGYTTLERLWTRPTFDVHGLLSGFTGVGAKTVLPAVAMAKVSMRLVADQDAHAIGDLFEAYVRAVAPATAEVTVTRMQAGNAWTTSVEHPFVRAAGRALELGFGARPVFTRDGGSNPAVQTFADVLGSPVVLFELGLPDDNPHAPNERLGVSQFQNGIVAAAHLYEEIARSASRDLTFAG
jgi:acetylornithine deacetylase/succinyl-diaminopimelate desuccinylase-like protein